MSDNNFLGGRIQKARKAIGMSQDALAEELGMGRPNLSHIENGKINIDSNMLVKIANILMVDMGWLLNGDVEAPIIINEPPTKDFSSKHDKRHEEQLVPLYDITASAGLTSLYNSTSNILDYIQIPNLPRCDGAIYVKGDSMYPLLKHGDMVAFQRLVDIPDEIDFGGLYVVDMSTAHLERIYVKYVQKSEKGEEWVKLVSYNEKHHPSKDVLVAKIKAMAAVKASIRLS